MTTRNEITGDSLRTRPSSDSYRDNFDRIFGKKPPKYHVTRNDRGTHAQGVPGAIVGVETFHTFQYALSAYGHLLKRGETLTGEEWAQRIEASFYPTPRLGRVVEAIREVLPS